jgi:hypothetical protein
MTIVLIVLLNAAFGMAMLVALTGVVALAHRLPASAPDHDHSWGLHGDPWVISDPLPEAQLVAHEYEQQRARAA